MLDRDSFVVKLGSKGFEILDGETGKPLGSARVVYSGFMAILGMLVGKENVPATLEIRDKDKELVFAIRRRGFFLKKIEALDGEGRVIGTYKSKLFSLSGGFHVYDKKGKHFAEVKGKMLKAEYRFLEPGGGEMGSVTRTWGGLAKSLFTGGTTYGVKIDAAGVIPRMLLLGASMAIDTLLKKGKGAKKLALGGDDGDDDSGGESDGA
jgi:uncharacterized protein YxjI